MKLKIILIGMCLIVVFSGCTWENEIDKKGTLVEVKEKAPGIYFCSENKCFFVKDLGKESKFGYHFLKPLADKNAVVHIKGEIKTITVDMPHSEPDCELLQMGCRQQKSLLIIKSLSVLGSEEQT
jgi:hypothetical protein